MKITIPPLGGRSSSWRCTASAFHGGRTPDGRGRDTAGATGGGVPGSAGSSDRRIRRELPTYLEVVQRCARHGRFEADHNEQNVIACHDLMFNQNRPAEAIECNAGARYLQHNPHVGDGKQAFVEYFDRMAAEHPDMRVEFVRALADGDFVVLAPRMTPTRTEAFEERASHELRCVRSRSGRADRSPSDRR